MRPMFARQKGAWVLLFAVILCGIFASSSTLLARGEGKDEFERQSGGETVMSVPSFLRDRGYKIKIQGKSYRLDEREITVDAYEGTSQWIALYDQGNHLAAYAKRSMVKSALNFDAQSIRPYLAIGATGYSDNKLNGLIFGKDKNGNLLPAGGLGLVFQPTKLGFIAGTFFSGHTFFEDGVTTSYNNQKAYVGVSYEESGFSLFKNRGFLSRVQPALSLGIGHSRHRLVLRDELVNITAASASVFPLLGLDLRVLIGRGWHALLSSGATYEHVKLKEFHYDKQVLSTFLLVGGGYAF